MSFFESFMCPVTQLQGVKNLTITTPPLGPYQPALASTKQYPPRLVKKRKENLELFKLIISYLELKTQQA